MNSSVKELNAEETAIAHEYAAVAEDYNELAWYSQRLAEARIDLRAAIAAVEAEGDGWIDVKQELPPMCVACSWDDPHHKGGFTTSELVETWHPNASADRTTLQGQRKFQRRISYLKDKDSNWVHADATHWRYPAAPPLPSPRSRYE